MSQLPPSTPPYGQDPWGGVPIPPTGPPWPPPARRRSRWPAIVAAMLMVVVLVATVVGVLAVRAQQAGEPGLVEAERTDPAPVPTAPPSAIDVGLLTERFGAAVWRVEATGCGMESVGTAFVVGDRLLVTNQHVTAVDTSPQVSSLDGSRVLGATVLGWTLDPDLAVLEVAEPLTPVLTWASAAQLADGQRLLVLGYPRPAHAFTATPTAIRRFVTDAGVRRAIVSDAPLVQGNSGGPALTADGRVAGVVTELAGEQGAPLVPVLYTYDHLRDTIAAIVAARRGAVVDCDAVSSSR